MEPGTELDAGKYRIVRLLNQCGVAAVYEAEHTRGPALRHLLARCRAVRVLDGQGDFRFAQCSGAGVRHRLRTDDNGAERLIRRLNARLRYHFIMQTEDCKGP